MTLAGSPSKRRRRVVGSAFAFVFALVGLPGVAWADITVMEGQLFSGPLVVTGNCGQPPGNVTVDWGDGTTSPGAPTADGLGVQGTHTYAEEGSFNGTVTYDCPQQSDFPLTAPFRATVQDATLAVAGQNSAGSAQVSFSAVVAHVADANPAGSVSELSATIAWGDGTTSAGTVSPAAGGGFDVTGTHSYSAAGSYPVATTVTDAGGSTATGSSTAQITVGAPPPPVFDPPVARFTYAPVPPCSHDQVAFDGSSSSGGGRAIIRYRWTIVGATVPSFYGPQPVYQDFHGPTGYSDYVSDYGWTEVSYADAGKVYVPGIPFGAFSSYIPADHMFPARLVTVLHRPVTVSLRITARGGSSSTRRRTIAFRDPVEHVVVAYFYDNAARPDFSRAIGEVRTDYNCDARSAQQKVGLSALKLRPSVLGTRPAVLQQSGNDAAVTVFVPCLYARLGCDGILELDAVNSSRRRHARPRVLGVARFLARPGRRGASVKMKLNAFGAALARTRRLRRVTLRLLSAGTNGRISATSRSIIIVGGRTGRR